MCITDQLGVKESGSDQSSVEMESFSQCQQYCASKSDCYVWTFYGGACYLKGNNTVLYPENRVSGLKQCNSSGNSSQLNSLT